MRRLTILVRCAGGEAFAGRADRYRADVHAAGLGSDGYCGFSLALPPGVAAKPFQVTVAPSMAPLPGDVRRDAGLPPAADVQVRAGLRFVVGASGGQLAGWIRAAAGDDARRLLRLEGRGSGGLHTRACLYDRRSRQDGGDGFHGFSIPVPAGAGTLRLLDEVTGTELHRMGS